MNVSFSPSLLLGCLLSLCILFSCSAQKTGTAGKAAVAETVVYVVRHAEKATTGGDDPALSEAGNRRAQVLRDQLQNAPVAALYATKYKRTQETVQPIATVKNVPVQIYEAHDFAGLAQKIKQDHKGKTVVVAGHSNTVLPLVEAMGAKKPINEIADYQYDHLFKVTLREGQEPQVEMMKFGEASVAPVK